VSRNSRRTKLSQASIREEDEEIMRRLAIVILAAAFAAVGTNALAQCVIMTHNTCSTTFGNPACTYAPENTCIYDAIRCRSSCGTGGWQDCELDPYTCPDYQW